MVEEIKATTEALTLAKELGIDIANVVGTGMLGQVLIGDVRAFVGSEELSTPPAPPNGGPPLESRVECSECGALIELSKRTAHMILHELANTGAAAADMVDEDAVKVHAIAKKLDELNIPFLTIKPKRIIIDLIANLGWDAVIPHIKPIEGDPFSIPFVGYYTSDQAERLVRQLRPLAGA